MAKRSVDESLDRIASFFENVASFVRDGGGIFMSDDFSAVEKRAIVRACESLASRHRDEAMDARREVK